jgi:cytoskeleton protein RodZ
MSEQERAEGMVSTAAAAATTADEAAREIGTTLAKARAAQGMTLQDVSARLKVAAPKLGAIEAGNVAALPDLTFAKGLMRAYARILNVNIDPLLARFHAQAIPTVDIAARRQGSLNQSFDDRNRFGSNSSGGRWIWLAIVVIVVGAGVLFGLDHAKQWFEAQKTSLTAPPAVEEKPVETKTEAGTVTSALPPMEIPDASAPGAAVVPGQPVQAMAQAVAPQVGQPVPAAAPVTAGATATASGPGELRIRFAGETWYEVRDRNGKIVLSGTAKAGDDVSGGGVPPYKVIIGNAKGVESMSRNGSPVDVQGASRNNVARMTLP